MSRLIPALLEEDGVVNIKQVENVMLSLVRLLKIAQAQGIVPDGDITPTALIEMVADRLEGTHDSQSSLILGCSEKDLPSVSENKPPFRVPSGL